MGKAKNLLAATVLTATAIAGCLKSTVEPRDFFTVATSMKGLTDGSVDGVAFVGTLDSLERSSVETCGFIYSPDADAVVQNAPSCTRVEAASKPVGRGEFRFDLTGIKPGERVHFRAWARIGEREVLAPPFPQMSYALGDLVYVAGPPVRKNDRAMLKAATVGLYATGHTAAQHGFVYGKMPVAGPESCPFSTALGPIQVDAAYSDTLRGLDFNSTYRAWAYVEVGGKPFFSHEHVDVVLTDGWQFLGAPLKGLGGLSDGSFAEAPGGASAVGGFGCSDAFGVCDNGMLLHDLLTLGSIGDSATLGASPLPPIVVGRSAASMLVLDGAAYVFFGENEQLPIAQFSKLPLAGGAWSNGPQPTGRSGCASFVLGGRAYFVAGDTFETGTNARRECNEVWQFDPVAVAWKKMAPLPMKQAAADAPNAALGRRRPIGFAIGGAGYAGGGAIDGLMLKDFWRFTPPTPAEPLGRWDEAARLPDEAKGRIRAAGFAIGAHGYFGTGTHLTDGDLADWWRYDTLKNQWSPCEPFPGGARSRAFGVAVGGSGYLGGGNSRTGASYTARTDVWRYVPEQ